LLASGKLDAVQTAHAIEAIERAGWAQSRLIEDLLDISRIAAGQLRIETRPTAIPPLIEAAAESLRPAADAKHITIDLRLDRTLAPVAVDPDRMQQVAWNLLSNAIKFTHSGGVVELALDIDGTDLVLSVRDTGIGFP